jgi:membrane protease YdiL (CAAX protease family)
MLKTQSDAFKKRGIIVFFSMTYAISWIIWIPIALSSNNILLFHISPFPGIIIGGMAPSLVGLILILEEQGISGTKSLLGRLFQWKVNIRWYIFVLCIPAVIISTSIIINSIFANVPINISTIGDWRIILITFIVTLFIGGPIGEELGWRGYALPKMGETRKPLLASLIVGLGWGLWHLPLFWINGSLQADIPVIWFIVSILAESVLYTWIYTSTGGNLFLMVLFHTSINAWAKLLLLPVITNNVLPLCIAFSFEVLIAIVVIVIKAWKFR